jgi:hypothetical protein
MSFSITHLRRLVKGWSPNFSDAAGELAGRRMSEIFCEKDATAARRGGASGFDTVSTFSSRQSTFATGSAVVMVFNIARRGGKGGCAGEGGAPGGRGGGGCSEKEAAARRKEAAAWRVR